MSTYTIISGNQRHSLRESGGLVTAASAVFDWSIGLSFEHVRSYCERKGWTIVPFVDELDVTTFNYEGDQYCIYTDGTNVKQITKNDHEIPWNRLPSILKGLL